MSKALNCIMKDDYKPKFTLIEVSKATFLIKDVFQKELSKQLNLFRVHAPLMVPPATGVNDDLNGYERPVEFDIKHTGENIQIIHSLAKWKRKALKKFGYKVDEGIYCDMKAIRRDEELDNTHSLYVDQWSWEKIIKEEERNFELVKKTVKGILQALRDTEKIFIEAFPEKKLTPFVPEDIVFISSQELEDKYPDKTPKEREDIVTKEHKAVFVTQIGKILKSGKSHDGRSPDYDDWELNGDILVWHETLGRALEISSMGIRVNKESLKEQLKIAGVEERKNLEFHQMLLNDELPLTMGGGIGQSRVCMYLMQVLHIGEVQSSLWPKDMIRAFEEKGIEFL